MNSVTLRSISIVEHHSQQRHFLIPVASLAVATTLQGAAKSKHKIKIQSGSDDSKENLTPDQKWANQIVFYEMLANCGANTQRQERSAYVLPITKPNEWCITDPEIVFAHTRLAIVQDLWCRGEKQLVSIFYAMHSFIQLFPSIASNVWCFSQFFIFPQLFNALAWWKVNAVVVGELFRISRLISRSIASVW